MIRSFEDWNALVIDTRSLDGLRAKARTDPSGTLKSVAREFEAVLMQMMLKSMRQAGAGFGLEGAVLDSREIQTYQAMLDQQLVRSAASRGLGLAERLAEQLSRIQAGAGTPAPPPRMPASTPSPPSTAEQAPAPSAPEGFIGRLWKHAQAAAQALGLPARFVIGHAALESGWGRHEIRHPDGRPSHNLFGIKAGAGWTGDTVEVVTTEYVNGRAEKRIERFRAYDSYAEAFADYARLLSANPRYARVLAQGRDPEAFARELARAGYATDPAYAQKLTAVLKSPGLSALSAG